MCISIHITFNISNDYAFPIISNVYPLFALSMIVALEKSVSFVLVEAKSMLVGSLCLAKKNPVFNVRLSADKHVAFKHV